MSFNYLLKFIIVGDSSVGKSCLLLKFTDDKFNINHDTTIGVEFASKLINYNNINFKLQIWDTAGQEQFRSICRSYYRNAVGVILCFDVSSKKSFLHIKRWFDEVNKEAIDQIIIILVGNKIDKINHEVTREEALEFASKYKISYIETSAKIGKNINMCFTKLTENIYNNFILDKIEVNHSGIKFGQPISHINQKDQELSLLSVPMAKYNCC